MIRPSLQLYQFLSSEQVDELAPPWKQHNGRRGSGKRKVDRLLKLEMAAIVEQGDHI